MTNGHLPSQRFGDLLPLPLLSVPRPDGPVTRTERRRGQRLRKCVEEVDDTVSGLNVLAGFPCECWPGAPWNSAQSSTMHRIKQLHAERVWPKHGVKQPRAALHELLRQGPSYGNETVGAMAPFEPGLVSIPVEHVGSADLLDVLPSDLRCAADNFESHFLIDGDSLGHIFEGGNFPKAYFDPVLAQDEDSWASFLVEMYRAGIVSFKSSKGKVDIGLIVVRKNVGRLRLICDCRPTNVFSVGQTKQF